MVALLAIPSRPLARTGRTRILADIKEGFAFIRHHVCWGTLGMASLWVLLLLGALDVLVPYIVKNDLGGGAGALGLVYACGGIGAIGAAILTGQHGLPRRPITWMLIGWSAACATVTGIALASSAWQAALALLAFQALFTVSEIIWITLLQRLVPTQLLGRVRSLQECANLKTPSTSDPTQRPTPRSRQLPALVGCATVSNAVAATLEASHHSLRCCQLTRLDSASIWARSAAARSSACVTLDGRLERHRLR